ncbi:hypothetical protein ACJDU8_15770 [Clostridium sp. WILCCON 0269]|uniref:Phage portal protein n=1 Tax=Candidatus Clostridium eludens TaxID=3381663 RepID=A0ABW8SLX3_9CLOT
MGAGNDMKQLGVEIELDRKRRIIFDLNSLCDMEEKYGSINDAIKAVGNLGKGGMKDFKYVLWKGLSNEDEKLTEEDAGRLIDAPMLGMLSDKLLLALGLSLPKDDRKLKNEGTKGTEIKKKDSLGQD